MRHSGLTLLAAPHEQTESTPGRGGTFGRATPFQAVTRPKVSTTLVLDHSSPAVCELLSSDVGLSRDTTRWLGSAVCLLLLGPRLDLGPKPELDSALAKVDHRLGHGRIAALVKTDAVSLGQSEQLSNPVSVQEIIGVDKHFAQSKPVDGSVRPSR
jgi:hypothetical protein